MSIHSIQEIDQNFAAATEIPSDVTYYDVFSLPFHVDGLYDPCGIRKFCRLPLDFIGCCNEGVQQLAWHTAGGRIRFATDSPWVAVAVQLRGVVHMAHMPNTGHSSVDVYAGPRGAHAGEQKFRGTIFCAKPQLSYTGLCSLGGSTVPQEVTLNLPLYNGVEKLYIGIQKDASLWEPAPYRIEKPVLFYGSSITQGGCASRPGNNYVNHLSRWLDFNFTCLGFSGAAKGEQSMAEYIASLDLSAFVLDYDHNAYDEPGEPVGTALRKTHAPFYETVRKAQPDLPIIVISRPNFTGSIEDCVRRDIVLETYLRARENGDDKIWFVDGETLFQDCDRDACTVDGCHPNDLGFYRMAETVRPKLAAALGL